jgi:hypothetical protein
LIDYAQRWLFYFNYCRLGGYIDGIEISGMREGRREMMADAPDQFEAIKIKQQVHNLERAKVTSLIWQSKSR